MADRVGQIYVPTGAAELRDRFLRDIRLAAIDAGVTEPPVTPGTDWYMLGTAIANIALVGFANIAIGDDDASILNATGDALEQKRVELGLPEVATVGSTGKIIVGTTGSATILAGTQLLLPNGLRIEVVGTWINPSDGAEIDVAAVDTGTATNFPGNTEVRFVGTQPPNVEELALVSPQAPLVGGLDSESDSRKRIRIINAQRNRPSGGNWSHLREITLNALPSVTDCFVYPAIGGPGSCKVVPVRAFDVDNRDFSRALGAGGLAVVRAAIHAQVPSPEEIVIQSAVDQNLDVALSFKLPESVLAGGNGQGWVDASPWPPLVGGDSGRVTVTSSTATTLTVTAQTSTEPVAAQTHIAWWSRNDRKFYTALIVSSSGSAGAWVLTLDVPLVDSTGSLPQSGDFVSPAARNLNAYGSTWVTVLQNLGPGENTTDANRLPRAKRHPFVENEAGSDIGSALYCEILDAHSEIVAFTQQYASATTPTVPASVATGPSIFVPRHFAIYRQA